MAVLLIVAGLVTLVVGAELLVRSGSALATRLGIPPIVVGLTVVSIGTSMPEMAVGVDAALRDAGPLAVGNIAGTNIVNLLLILGLSTAMVPLVIDLRTIRFEVPIVVGVSILLVLLAMDGNLSRSDAGILVAIAVVYTVAVVVLALRDPNRSKVLKDEHAANSGLLRQVAILGAGLVILTIGADWLVQGAVDLASELGVSEVVIGLTVVAIGSSAPELVTTILSTIRGERDIAVGNLIGSSIYNIALILGITAMVAPLEVTRDLVRVDLPLMALVAVLLVPVFATGRRVSRAEGVAMVLAYVLYLGIIVTTRT